MRSLAGAARLLIALIGIAAACAPRQPSANPAPSGDVQEICRGAAPPAGWLTMDSHWDRDRCRQTPADVGGLAGQAGQGDNVLTIWRYDDKPVGTEQQVCAHAPTPPGWVATSHRWDPTRCRLGQGTDVFNVKTIKRVS